MKFLINTPILLPSSKTLLQHLVKKKPHLPTLLACLISDKKQEFQQRISESYRRVDVPRTSNNQNYHITKWKAFCHEGGVDPISGSADQPIEFLTKIFESCVGYSSIGTARLAQFSILKMESEIYFTEKPLVQ